MTHPPLYYLTLASLLVLCIAPAARAQPDAPPASAAIPAATAEADDASPAGSAAAGVRRALILCGLAGDADHRKLFADSLEVLYAGLTAHHGFASENVYLYWGDEPLESDGPAIRASRGVLTREALAAATSALQADLQAADTLWVFVFGHAHYDGRFTWLNISGPDVNHQEFGRQFETLRCREQVFFVTTATSGFFLKPLAAAGRIVITATEPDLEVNETLFPHKLARVLGPAPPAYKDFDQDADGRLSLLDLYLLCARQTAEDYATNMLLATEHSLLDDSGDGRGTELQIDYLPEELGGRLRAGQSPPPLKAEGMAARRIRLAWPPSPPVPEATDAAETLGQQPAER